MMNTGGISRREGFGLKFPFFQGGDFTSFFCKKVITTVNGIPPEVEEDMTNSAR